VVLNDKFMYKDHLQEKKQENANKKYIMLDEITKNEIPKVLKNQNVQQQ
jgi:predicted AAA+ superfamily ATPase